MGVHTELIFGGNDIIAIVIGEYSNKPEIFTISEDNDEDYK